MIRSLFRGVDRATLLGRLRLLTPDRRAEWGTMTPTRMLAHVNDGFSLAFHELPTRPRKTWLRVPPVNLIVACVIPFPRHAPAPHELLSREPGTWDVETRRLHDNIEEFAVRAPRGRWPDHPFFGHMPRWAWGVLGYRHVDHHFRQFGV